MSVYIWLVFIVVALFSFYPMSFLKIFNTNKRYRYYKYVTILLFIWTIHTWLRLGTVNPILQYYLGITLYPLVFLITGILLLAVLNYLGKTIHKIYFWLVGGFFLVELLISLTNPIHELMVKIQPSSAITYQAMLNSADGIFFYIHTAICYILLLTNIIMIISFLYRNLRLNRDRFPFWFIVIGIIFGMVLNLIHVFINPFLIDPTYITFVMLIFSLYFLMYIRDIKLILEMGRNNFLLDNLREMYVIVNHLDVVIDASEEFINYFKLDLNKNIHFDELLAQIISQAVVFTDKEDLSLPFDNDRRYLHMQKKQIEIPLSKYTGKFYLFYDETDDQKHMNEMNYVKSHDLMTGLYNRNHFEEIKIEIDSSNQSYALAMFDLDGLKIINDYLGHEAGDNQLKIFADKLRQICHTYKMTPIRMGGDEFLLLAMNMNYKMFSAAMSDILSVLKSDDGEDDILFSYGYAERESKEDQIEWVVSRADETLYDMKLKNASLKLDLIKKLENQRQNK